MRYEYSGSNWFRTPYSSNPTIIISEMSEGKREERERKIKQGAHVVPFGFSRALEQEPAPVVDQPLVWEGMD